MSEALGGANEILKKMSRPRGLEKEKPNPLPQVSVEKAEKTEKENKRAGKMIDQKAFQEMIKKSVNRSGCTLDITVEGEVSAKCSVKLKKGKKRVKSVVFQETRVLVP